MSDFTKGRISDFSLSMRSALCRDEQLTAAAYLLDALDARVRALETKSGTTDGEVVGDYFERHPPMNVDEDQAIAEWGKARKPEPKLAVIQQKVLEAVAKERERCARVAEKAMARGACKLCGEIAAEIRRST